MHPITLVLFCLSTLPALAQEEQPKKLVLFDGYLMLNDSTPVENAYLINYRDMKIIATDSTGYFRTRVQSGDSLMINHLSLAPKVIRVSSSPTAKQRIEVEYRHYVIQPVIANEYAYQMRNFEKNMSLLRDELQRAGFATRVPRPYRANPYNDAEVSPGLTVNLADMVRLFKRRK